MAIPSQHIQGCTLHSVHTAFLSIYNIYGKKNSMHTICLHRVFLPMCTHFYTIHCCIVTFLKQVQQRDKLEPACNNKEFTASLRTHEERTAWIWFSQNMFVILKKCMCDSLRSNWSTNRRITIIWVASNSLFNSRPPPLPAETTLPWFWKVLLKIS